MALNQGTSATVEEYLADHTGLVRDRLEEIRAIILSSAPEAEEVISYGMPAYRQRGILVYFAAAKNHIGFYPTSSPIVAFAGELTRYRTSKGAIQFPLDRPIPKTLVRKIVAFRIREERAKGKPSIRT